MAYLCKIATVAAFAVATTVAAINPNAIYDGGIKGNNGLIELAIGNGGAGQSGLIKGNTFHSSESSSLILASNISILPSALADAYIQDAVSNGTKPFRVAWYTSDTTYSIEYLQSGLIDVGITYSPAAEKIAIDQGIALSPSYYAFRDHFLLVGPKANPANLSMSTDIFAMFSQIRTVAENEQTTPPVRFLSRYDKSATNIKDSLLWVSIGQVSLHNLQVSISLIFAWFHQLTFPKGSLGYRLLYLVPSIHCFPHPGSHGCHSPRRVYNHRSRHYSVSGRQAPRPDGHLQGRFRQC